MFKFDFDLDDDADNVQAQQAESFAPDLLKVSPRSVSRAPESTPDEAPFAEIPLSQLVGLSFE